MTGAIAASWLGEVVHNALSLSAAVLLGPETLGPGAVSVLLAVAYARRPRSRIVQALLLAWGLLNLVIGGVLSVLPIELFPFVPDQSVRHYAARALYALTQVPLVWCSIRALRAGRERGTLAEPQDVVASDISDRDIMCRPRS